MRDQLLRRRDHAWPEPDYRMHPFSPRIVRYTDDGALGDRLVAVECFFGFRRIDILAPADDHVLNAVDDVDEPIIVHVSAVTGMQPSIAQCALRQFRLLPISQ